MSNGTLAHWACDSVGAIESRSGKCMCVVPGACVREIMHGESSGASVGDDDTVLLLLEYYQLSF